MGVLQSPLLVISGQHTPRPLDQTLQEILTRRTRANGAQTSKDTAKGARSRYFRPKTGNKTTSPMFFKGKRQRTWGLQRADAPDSKMALLLRARVESSPQRLFHAKASRRSPPRLDLRQCFALEPAVT